MPAWYHDAFPLHIFSISPHLHPVEVKTVVCVLSPADGPLIVLKQTCRHWESRGSCSEALGRQPEWKGRVPGDQRRINSTVQLRVMPLCVYSSVPPNTGQDPLIPPSLLSLISVAAFGYPTKRNLLLPWTWRTGCKIWDFYLQLCGIFDNGTRVCGYNLVSWFNIVHLRWYCTLLGWNQTLQCFPALIFSGWSTWSGWISCRGSFWCFRSFKWFKV